MTLPIPLFLLISAFLFALPFLPHIVCGIRTGQFFGRTADFGKSVKKGYVIAEIASFFIAYLGHTLLGSPALFNMDLQTIPLGLVNVAECYLPGCLIAFGLTLIALSITGWLRSRRDRASQGRFLWILVSVSLIYTALIPNSYATFVAFERDRNILSRPALPGIPY